MRPSIVARKSIRFSIMNGCSARNSYIVKYPEAELPANVITRSLDNSSIPDNANGSFCYARLALEAVLEQLTYPTDPRNAVSENLPGKTVRGSIAPGANREQLRTKLHQSDEGISLHISKNFEASDHREKATRTFESGDLSQRTFSSDPIGKATLSKVGGHIPILYR
jgi:hypothetical protein